MSLAPPTQTRRQPSKRASYTPQQLHAVYERLGLPRRFRYEPGDFSREVVRHRDGHGFLTALQRHALATIPFETLGLHYSSQHQISIHSDALFNKIVRRGAGRGGYCLENNAFFGTVMRSVGFDVMTVGARVNTAIQPAGGVGEVKGRFGGFSHMVNLVRIRGGTFLVDIGFGAGGPTRPLELIADREVLNVAPGQKVRLRHDSIPENEHSDKKLWILERKDDDAGEEGEVGEWMPLYCFDDTICFLPPDFEVMNHFTSTHRTSFFTFRVICTRAILSEDKNEIVGEVTMYQNEVYRKINGKKERLELLETEQQRIDALEEYFDLQLDEAEIVGIRGMVSELGAVAPL